MKAFQPTYRLRYQTMRIPRTDQGAVNVMIDELLHELIQNPNIDTTFARIGMLDLRDEENIEVVAELEHQLLESLRLNPGFLRHSQASSLCGFKSGATLAGRFFPTKTGESTRALKDGSEVVWNNRPDDIFTPPNSNKSFVGWNLNTYISHVLPWLRGRQSDRIISEEESRIFKPKPISLVVKSPKGGSEKTTETVHLAVLGALLGFRVLVIDGDPQTTASTLLGYPFAQYPIPGNYSLHTAISDLHNDSFGDEYDATDYARPTVFENVDIIAGSTYGSLIDMLIQKDETLIDRFMDNLRESGKYDLIFVDTRPQSIFQDLAQYSAADVIINALPANATGLASTRQGLHNYIGYTTNKYPDIKTRRHQVSVTTPTCVDSGPYHVSRDIFDSMVSKSQQDPIPANIAPINIRRSSAIADAASSLETVFQQTNIAISTKKTKSCMDDFIRQFEHIYNTAIVYHWLQVDGEEVSEDLVINLCGAIDDPLQITDAKYRYIDLGFAHAIENTTETISVIRSRNNLPENFENPHRFLRACDLGLNSGNQIVMKDGKYYALSYDLDELRPLNLYVHRANCADSKLN